MGNTPKLRFEGFTDAWEQRKLGDITISYSGGTPTAGRKEFYGGDIPFIRSGEISEGHTELFLTEVGLKNSSATMVNKGDILYALYGATSGEVSRSQIKGAINQAILAILPHTGYDAEFLMQWLRMKKKTIIETYLQGGQGNLSGAIVKNLKVNLPIYEEQAKIGDILAKVDSLITFHQRKCDVLTKAKAFYLQNLFPQEGEKEPRLRLEGFTDSWNPYTLGDLYTERNERGNETLQILTVSIHTGVSDGALEEDELGKSVRRSEDKTLYKHVYAGDLIFNMMRAWQGAIGVAKREGMISPAYISAIPDERIYPPFMNYLLRRKEIISQINNLSYGVTDFRKRLYWDSFIKVKCCLPSVDEQKIITDVFEQLDTLITRQEHRIKVLKTLKKFMLQNMFPQEG